MDKIKVLLAAALEALYGFRKFLVMMSLLVSGVVFLSIGKINGREFVDLLQATSVSFFAANTAEMAGGVISDWLKKKVG